MELFLIRHGETEENKNGIIQGWTNTELNEAGKVQAQDAARLFNEEIEAIFSSDLKRASDTAMEFRNKYPELPYTEDARLRERDFGAATGDSAANYDWSSLWTPTETPTIPNLESLNTYDRRVDSFIQSISHLGYKRILIVTHSGTINRLLTILDSNHPHTDYKNGSATRATV